MDYFTTDIDSLHAQLVAGTITAADLTKDTLAKIAEIDPDIDAFLNLNDQAQVQAQAVDAAGINADQHCLAFPWQSKTTS